MSEDRGIHAVNAMNKKILFNLVFSVFLFSLYLFNYLGKMNSLTRLKLELPKMEKELYLLTRVFR